MSRLSPRGLVTDFMMSMFTPLAAAGGIINSGTANSVNGQLTYTLPDFSKDIAVKVTGVIEIYDLDAFSNYWLQTGSQYPGGL